MRTEATRVLVTGGAGFVGGHLVRALVGAGHPVRVLDDFSTGRRDRLTGLAVEIADADVRDAAAVRRAMKGVQVVFHLAWVAAPMPSQARGGELAYADEVNVVGALNVLEAARLIGPERVVLASSGSVYGKASAYVLHEEIAPQPLTASAALHLAVENLTRVYREAYRLPAVVLRIFRAFGPSESWRDGGGLLIPQLARAAIEGSTPTIHGDGRQTRDFVYVDNVVAALVAAGSVRGIDGNVYNVASGEPVSVAHLWQTMAQLSGWRRDAPEPSYIAAPLPEPDHMRVSIARACRDLGYSPAVLLREGLRRTLEHYREEMRSSPNGWFSPLDPPSTDAIPPVAPQPKQRLHSRVPIPPRPGRPAPAMATIAPLQSAPVAALRPSLLRIAPSASPPVGAWWGNRPATASPPPPPVAAPCIELACEDLEYLEAVEAAVEPLVVEEAAITEEWCLVARAAPAESASGAPSAAVELALESDLPGAPVAVEEC